MRHPVLESGAIVCSIVTLYGWAQTGVSKAQNPDYPVLPEVVSSSRPAPLPRAAQAATPERLSQPQWGEELPLKKLPKDVERVYSQLLEQAQAIAQRQQYAKALPLIVAIPKNSQSYGLAQQLQEDWAREVLEQATQHYQQARVAKAMAILGAIPPNSPFSDRASRLRSQWSREAKWLTKALTAKQAGHWQAANDALNALEGSPLYQSLMVQDLVQQVTLKLYEPDETLMRMAMADFPTVELAVAPPDVIQP